MCGLLVNLYREHTDKVLEKIKESVWWTRKTIIKLTTKFPFSKGGGAQYNRSVHPSVTRKDRENLGDLAGLKGRD
jgi:hypothetical protein